MIQSIIAIWTGPDIETEASTFTAYDCDLVWFCNGPRRCGVHVSTLDLFMPIVRTIFRDLRVAFLTIFTIARMMFRGA